MSETSQDPSSLSLGRDRGDVGRRDNDAPTAPPDRVNLLGLLVDPVTETQAIDRVFSSIDHGLGGVVLTPNLDHLRRYTRDPTVRAAYHQADLVLADGMPLVWASRVQRTPLPERVAGSDLIWSVSDRAQTARARVFLLGGAPGSAPTAAARLTDRFPGLDIAGYHFPAYGFLERDDDVQAMIEALVDAAPDIVFLGLPSPTAEQAMSRIRPHLPGAWFFGLGISISFVAGDVRRAPNWVRRTGLEWVWRLIQEPRRLARRYLLQGLPFALKLTASALFRRIRASRERATRA